MKEGVVILVVILILLSLSAVRYRRQIAGMIGIARALKDARDAAIRKDDRPREGTSVQLVHCTKCGVWVPENKALRRSGSYVCAACV